MEQLNFVVLDKKGRVLNIAQSSDTYPRLLETIGAYYAQYNGDRDLLPYRLIVNGDIGVSENLTDLAIDYNNKFNALWQETKAAFNSSWVLPSQTKNLSSLYVSPSLLPK